uniref:Ectonucleotide pyrophosphatase/phosphodiesterase family member 6 n=1 Tax=Talaromyces marneffei PM1 TaxID=1077442 RepID=A0A093V8R0_TALMA
MDDGVRPSQLKYNQFQFTSHEREYQGQYGLLTSGHSIWRTSNGHCDTEPKIVPLQLLLAVPEPLKIRFSDNAPLATWPGVQGISESGRVNYITPLFLAWAYILSAKWVELLSRSPRHACKQKYLEGTPIQDHLSFDIGYETDEDEYRWWKAILSFGWETTTGYEGRTYLSPWSVTASDTPFRGEKSHRVDSNTPSFHTALEYVTRFCNYYGFYDQFSAALAAALYIPLLGGRTVLLPILKDPTKERRSMLAIPADSCSNSFSEHSEFLPYYMTLSCNTFGIRSLLCSTFFNVNVECNLVAWLEPCFAIIDPLIEREESTKLVALLGNRQPNVAALWLGAIIVGISKSVIRDIRIGLIALDLHAAAWTFTTESFITISPGKAEEKSISREDESRLLFILGSEGHTRPPRSPWKPFGKTSLEETELEIQNHANCNCHCLEYLSWQWESSDGKTLEDTGLNRFPIETCNTKIGLNNPQEASIFNKSESLSEIATRGIFEWLRSNGYPASESFIRQHSWFDIGSSEGE